MVDPSVFLPAITGALGGAASVGLFKGPVQTLEDWWFVNFGANLSERAALLRIQQEVNVKKLQDKILEEVVKIKPENVQEPKLNILGPALEASKYYIEDQELRDMFAKLIASSMDKTKNDIIHSSYVEIIKQMSPLDAENLVAISDENNSYRDLTCEIIANFSNGGFSRRFTNLYLGNNNIHSQSNLSISLSNLLRLGLIDITCQEHKSDELYLKFEELTEYQEVSDYIFNHNQNIDTLIQSDPENKSEFDKFGDPEILKGIIKITNYGKAFISICL